MSQQSIHDELTRALVDMRDYWDKKGAYISNEESLRLNAALKKMSLFATHATPLEREQIVIELQDIVKLLSVEIKGEAKELQAETNGGQVFTEDELDRINEYAYRRELVMWLNQVLERMYNVSPEFRP